MSIIGTTINWGEDQPVELPPEDRRRRVYLIGQTGTGKTTLLRNLILQGIHEGRGGRLSSRRFAPRARVREGIKGLPHASKAV
jgi:ABC-type transport system involved in cytochrome c biogenesis ATPase subunit